MSDERNEQQQVEEAGIPEPVGAEERETPTLGAELSGEGGAADAVEPGSAPEVPFPGGEGTPGVGGAAAAAEKLLRTREVVAELFAKLGADVDVEVRDNAEAIACSVRVKRGGAVLDVGPRGQVLESIQYLANRIVNRDAEGRKFIALELGGFRDAGADPAMTEMARRLGEAAQRIGKTLTVLPIQSRDRRIVHTTLAEMAGVKTRSEGEGILRRLLVEVAPKAPESEGT